MAAAGATRQWSRCSTVSTTAVIAAHTRYFAARVMCGTADGGARRAGDDASMATPLSALDTTFLELEDGDHSAHMHIGGILVFDGPAPAIDELRARLEERLAALPRYRQRLTSRTARGVRRPGWKDDPDFDIATHVTRAALPAPGGEGELLEWAGDFYSHRLDRARPLMAQRPARRPGGRALGARDEDAPLPRRRRRRPRRGDRDARRDPHVAALARTGATACAA